MYFIYIYIYTCGAHYPALEHLSMIESIVITRCRFLDRGSPAVSATSTCHRHLLRLQSTHRSCWHIIERFYELVAHSLTSTDNARVA